MLTGESEVAPPKVVKRTSYLRLITNLIISFHLVSNICIPSELVFLTLHIRMFRCKQHNVYISQHITKTVPTTVYGIYVFWLQGIYTWQSSRVEITFIVSINSQSHVKADTLLQIYLKENSSQLNNWYNSIHCNFFIRK